MMRSRGASAAAAGVQQQLQQERQSQWVNVTWMPHASLSQTSHVCLAVRSILTCRDEFRSPEEWQVRATIHGVAGLALVPISSLTPTSPVESLSSMPDTESWLPLASQVTHVCKLDALLHVPLRWRDLPRDAYLKLEVLGRCDEVVRR